MAVQQLRDTVDAEIAFVSRLLRTEPPSFHVTTPRVRLPDPRREFTMWTITSIQGILGAPGRGRGDHPQGPVDAVPSKAAPDEGRSEEDLAAVLGLFDDVLRQDAEITDLLTAIMGLNRQAALVLQGCSADVLLGECLRQISADMDTFGKRATMRSTNRPGSDCSPKHIT